MNKKNFVINGKFLSQRLTGVQRYAKEIVAHLDKVAEKDEFVILVPSATNVNIPDYKNIKVVRITSLSGVLWEQIVLPVYAYIKNRICLNLCNVAPIISPGISSIHDLKILKHPEFYSSTFRMWYKFLFANQTRRCKVIFTVSNCIKEDLLSYYPFLNENRVSVTYDSWEHYKEINFCEGILQKFGLERRSFYFSMCSIEPNKNLKWIAQIALKNPNDTFVVAGGINNKIFSEGIGFDCPGNMKLIGYIRDDEAKTLMRDSKAFLFPSFSEGFGIPPLEALAAGCPRVIVSDILVMHEIFRENAIYINPMSYDYNINNLIVTSYCDKESVLSRFSWKNSAQIIYEKIREIN